MLPVPRKKSTLPRGPQPAQAILAHQRAKAGPPALERRPQSAAIATLLDAIPAREGGRFIIPGASGKGKTHFTVRLAREMQRRRICETIVIHDQKDPERAQYDGTLVHSVDAARRILLEDRPGALVCREGIDAEQAAGLVRDMAEAGERLAFLGDELSPLLRVNPDTLEPVSQVFCGPSLPWLQLQGRGLGASSIILVPMPRQVPSSALDNATAYPVFGLGGRSLDYSLELRLIPKAAADVVAKLERGQLCVFFSDREWDGIIYGPE
jgi:hypothetical protein